MIKKEFPHIKKYLWKEYFWSRSYFLATTGGVRLETLKKYVENQGIEDNRLRKNISLKRLKLKGIIMQITKGFKYRIYPNKEQQILTNHQCFIYNQAYNIV